MFTVLFVGNISSSSKKKNSDFWICKFKSLMRPNWCQNCKDKKEVPSKGMKTEENYFSFNVTYHMMRKTYD